MTRSTRSTRRPTVGRRPMPEGGTHMIHRFCAYVRIEVLDAITAIRMGEYRYALPTPIFRRIYGA